MAAVRGVDVSHYQSGISMTAVKAAGCSFVIAKASESHSPDAAFRQHASNAKAAGLLVSAYHFLRSGDGAGQARVFLAAIDKVISAGVTVWADFEAGDHDTLHAFLAAVKAAGRPVGVYTGTWFWAPAVPGGCQTCAALPLWQSGYTSVAPRLPARWTERALWQFTDKFPVPGWPGGVDCSIASSLAIFTGSAQEDPFMALSDQQQSDLLAAVARIDQNGWNAVDRAALSRVDQRVSNVQDAVSKFPVLLAAHEGNADPQAIANEVADALGPDLAKQVLAALSAKLA